MMIRSQENQTQTKEQTEASADVRANKTQLKPFLDVVNFIFKVIAFNR
jgi:hypothetical protein